MGKKPNFQNENLPKLKALCEKLGLEIEEKDTYQFRVYGATHVIDIWPSRMVHHILQGENIKSIEPYYHELDWRFNEQQVEELLLTGRFK